MLSLNLQIFCVVFFLIWKVKFFFLRLWITAIATCSWFWLVLFPGQNNYLQQYEDKHLQWMWWVWFRHFNLFSPGWKCSEILNGHHWVSKVWLTVSYVCNLTSTCTTQVRVSSHNSCYNCTDICLWMTRTGGGLVNSSLWATEAFKVTMYAVGAWFLTADLLLHWVCARMASYLRPVALTSLVKHC